MVSSFLHFVLFRSFLSFPNFIFSGGSRRWPNRVDDWVSNCDVYSLLVGYLVLSALTMSTSLLGLVAAIYVGVALTYFKQHQYGMGVAFLAYAVANIGFMFV